MLIHIISFLQIVYANLLCPWVVCITAVTDEASFVYVEWMAV